MKKIDSWLDIQRYVREASQSIETAVPPADVELIARPGVKRRARIIRRVLKNIV